MHTVENLLYRGNVSIVYQEPLQAQDDIAILSTNDIHITATSGMFANRISLAATNIVLGLIEDTPRTLFIEAEEHISLYAKNITLLGDVQLISSSGHIHCEHLTIILPPWSDTVHKHLNNTLYRWLSNSLEKSFIIVPIRNIGSNTLVPTLIEIEGSDPEVHIILDDATLPEEEIPITQSDLKTIS